MTPPTLLVDGRVLDDQHPGIRRFWVPVLCAWAVRGGRGWVACQRGCAPDPALLDAGFSPVELRCAARNPLARWSCRRTVRQTGATATLSPLYLTLDGARRNLATVFDLIGRSHPRSWRSRLLWELALRRTTAAASGVICATEASARVLAATFPRLRGHITVVPAIAPPPPPRDPQIVARFGLTPPYALVIGSHRPHKRLDALAAAWHASGSHVPLVLLGAGTERLHAPPRVYGFGFVTDAERDACLADAGCLVSASVAEGFGLPLLAALVAGVPVVATRHAAIDEVAGEAAVWLEPHALDGLVGAALAALADPAGCDVRVACGRRRAQEFTATRAATQLAHALE